MADSIQKLKIQYLRSHKRMRRWKTTMIALCSVIALVTGYVLINPAQGQEQVTYCGYEEHAEHTEECYEKQLICTVPESGHTHGDDCYEETDVYICGLEETEGHTHTESCYGPVTALVCGLEETEGHTHTAECYQEIRTLSCGQEECAGHTHTDSCYEQQPVLICANTDPEHVHTEECYISEPVLICGIEECAGHTHSDGCYTVSQELICGREECDPHTHTDSCYGETTGLVCGLEERAPHTHDATCVQKEKQLVCTLEECEGHRHTEECYSQETVLVCEKPLHTHTLQCFSNPEADLESEAVWNRLVSGVQLSGVWADDLIAVARTQLGYAESSANYQVLEDGVSVNGYSRYGAWYGMPYGDWCAMFCAFCMHYAGIDSEFFPYDMTCDTWITALQNRVSSRGGSMFRYSPYFAGGAYAGSGEAYKPVKGDLVFFDTDGNTVADHVGIIYEVSEDGQSIATIEGNLADAVGCGSCHVNDAAIVGYGLLPENPCPCKDCYDRYGTRLCGEDCTCACHTEQDSAEENKEGEAGDENGEPETVSVSEELNGITVTVTGKLPEEAMLILSEVPEEQLQAILEEAGGDTSVFAYDITILDKDGTVWQPDELGAVVSITGLNVSEDEDLQVVHVPDEEEAVPEQVEAETTEGRIEFTAESFSVYVVYTVDFHYEDLTYSISGGDSILLSEIFTELGISENIADVADVTFSNPELLTAAKTEDGTDWILTSLLPFDTEETLTITFADGKNFSITVTDKRTETVTTVSTTNVSVKVRWLSGAPSTAVTATLYKDNAATEKTVSLNADNSWQGSFTAQSSGNYSIEFTTLSGYDFYTYYDSSDSYTWNKATSLAAGKTYVLVHNTNSAVLNSGTTLSNSSLTIENSIASGVVKSMEWYYDGTSLKNVLTGKYLTISNSSASAGDTASTISYSGSKLSSGSNYLQYTSSNNSSGYKGTTNSGSATTFTLYEETVASTNIDYEITGIAKTYNPASASSTNMTHNKTIDYLGDGTTNPDTGLTGSDYYRLYLDINGQTDPVDLLVVVDGSASMLTKDVDNMQRDKAITKFLNGSTTSSTSDGFLSYFMGLNTSNKYCVVQFYGGSVNGDFKELPSTKVDYTHDSKVLKDWTSTNTFINCEALSNNGTNYEAGLQRATSQFSSASVSGDGRRKIMLFLSDGVPTFYLVSSNDVGNSTSSGTKLTSTDVGKRYGNGQPDENATYCKEPSKTAFDDFKAANPGVIVYTIGVSKDINGSDSSSPDVLRYMAENASGQYIGVTDSTSSLRSELESLFYAADVSISDTLSKYVRYYDSQPDVLVTMQKTDKSEDPVPLYKNGAVVTGKENIIKSITYTEGDTAETPTGSTGTVTAAFQNGYMLWQDYTYTLSFNVKRTGAAKADYEANGNSYGGVKGADGTDYGSNSTSSNKDGFYSNDSAVVSYSVNGTRSTAAYAIPVVQVEAKQEYGYQLPETGGAGSEIYLLAGITAIGTAIVLSYITYKRKRNYYHENY